MFFIFDFFPNWFWWFILFAGLSGFFVSYLIPLKPYDELIKILGLCTVAASIFIFGMLYANNLWTAKANELQAQINIANAKAEAVTDNVKTRIVTETKYIQVKGDDIIKYINTEVVKYDNICNISSEFITAHNKAAELK